MDNRINVETVIQESKKKEQLRYIVVAVTGILLPFILWVFYFNKLESTSSRDFFTVVTIILAGFFLMYGIVQLVNVYFKEKNFRNALIKYACLIEKVQVPETAIITGCLKSGEGRFGFDVVDYSFWMEDKELVFYPVRPNYKTAKSYNLVQAVRLDSQMIRSYYVTGNEYFIVNPTNNNDNQEQDGTSSKSTKIMKPIFKDTRATILAYAVGDQTVYLTFSLNLFSHLKELFPDKDKEIIDINAKQALADSLYPIIGNPPVDQKDVLVSDLQILRENGTITEEEFQERKNKLLGDE